MRYRKLDLNGDMILGNQQSDFYLDTPDAVAQAVLTRLKLWVGEWFIDTDEGTPYQQAALGTGKRELIEPAMRVRILETQGVTGIDTFDLVINKDTRTATVSATVSTLYGQVLIVGII